METIPAIQINSGCRLYQDVLKHRFNDVLQLKMIENFHRDLPKKIVFFFEYVGNNIKILETINEIIKQYSQIQIFIVIDDCYEGLTNQEFLIQLKQIVDENDNLDDWMLLSSNKTLEKDFVEIFNTANNFLYFNIHLYMYEYDNVVPSQLEPTVNNQLRQKKFLCVNRQERVHRLRTIDFLSESNILPQCFASCQLGDYAPLLDENKTFLSQNPRVEQYQDADLQSVILPPQSKTRLKKMLPLELDVKNYQHKTFATQMPSLTEYFRESYISIVTEGDFSSKSGKRQFTEKVLKCFAHHHPFIVVGLPGTLSLLQEEGFLTFSSIINEDYDKEENDDKRLRMIFDEIEKLNSLNMNQMKRMYESIMPVLDHNYDNYVKVYNTNRPTTLVNKLLKWYYDL